MVYIGMKPAASEIEELQRELDIAYQKRKQEQVRRAHHAPPGSYKTPDTRTAGKIRMGLV